MKRKPLKVAWPRERRLYAAHHGPAWHFVLPIPSCGLSSPRRYRRLMAWPRSGELIIGSSLLEMFVFSRGMTYNQMEDGERRMAVGAAVPCLIAKWR